MKRCPKGCIIIVNKIDKFCYECGRGLIKGRECICGKGLDRLDKFCPKCGREAK